MGKKYKCLYLQVGKTVEEVKVENKLEVWQELVGGYIESKELSGNLVALFDEDGWIKELPANRIIPEVNLTTPVVGNILIIKMENGEQIDISEDDINGLY